MLDDLDISDSALRRILWEALDGYSDEELLGFCRERDVILRTSAAKKLHLRDGVEIFNGAVGFCKETESDIREIGCFILGQLGTPRKPFAEKSLPVLISMSRDSCSAVRASAIAALGHLSVPDSLGVILGAINDHSASVRLSAAFALGGFFGEKVVNALNVLMEDEDVGVREWAEVSLDCVMERLDGTKK